MSDERDEDRRLRSVALQNAAAIQMARQRAERELAAERERLRVTLASIGDAVICTDTEGRVTFLNGVAERLTGWPQAEAVGRSLPDVFRIVHEHTRQPVENPAARALREGTVVALANHTLLITRDGITRPIDDSAAPIRDEAGSTIGAVLVFRDVSDRKRAEEARAHLAAIVESSDDAIVSKTLDGVIRSWNAGAERVFGYTAAEAVGQPITLIIPPERLDEEREILARLRRGERIDHFETVRVRKDGQRIDISLTVSPVRAADGTIVGASKVARDITERRRAQAERARLAESLELALAAADLGTWEWDPTSDSVTLSDRAAAIYGVPPGRAYPREWIQGLIHPAYRDRARDSAARAAANRTDHDVEYPLERPAERPVWVAVRGRGVYDFAGELVRVLGVVQDVTARRSAEINLRESEERYRQLADNLPSGFIYQIVQNPAGERRFTYVSGGVEALCGFTPAEVVADPMKLYGQIVEEDRARVHAAEEEAIRGWHAFDCQMRIRVRGEVRWLHCRSAPRAGPGGAALWDGIAIEVTAHKRAEESLRAGEERLRLAVEIARMGAFELDPATGAVVVNDPGRKIYGWASRHTTFDRVKEHFPPDEREEILRRISAALDPAGPGEFEVEHRIRRADGAVRWLRVRGRASIDRDGAGRAATRLLGTFLDVTERKEAEEALRDSDRKKDDFIALLAHELRNPLAPIRNGIQVLRLTNDPAVRSRTQEMMDRQLTHMVRIVDDLLDVSRIGRHKMELRLDRVRLADTVTSAVETARPLIDAARHRLEVALPPDPVELDADPVRLAQVFANLLTNSAKYTEPGGHIRLAAARQNGTVVVEVRDTGIGIPAESLPTLFDMFSQLDRGVERTTGGLGIGLALVKGLVEMHGGTVTAASAGPGQGSAFTVTLPVADRPAPAPTAPEPPPTPTGPRLRVLVADDNTDAAESMAEMLGLLGDEVRTAHDGLEAVAAADEFRPQVIFMDVGMPKLTGLEATKQLRAREWARETVIVALTGRGQEADRERSRAAGCDDHLVKPVGLAELQKLLAPHRR